MKIHWFSPLPPAHTDIANYTARLAPYLANLADVVYCHDHITAPTNFPYPNRSIKDLSATELNQADLNVYHIGNNADFHGEIWNISQRHPGLVVLHDFAVHQFVHEFLNVHGNRNTPRQSDVFIRLMHRFYGDAGYRAALDINAGRLSPATASVQFPLCEAVAAGNLAVLTHNLGLLPDLEERLPLVPIIHLPLPYPLPTAQVAGVRDTGSILRVVSFGFTGPNRRLLEFLQAWADSPVRDKFELDICGELWNEELVREAIFQCELVNQVRVHGFVSDIVLNKLLDKANLVLNLRYPSMGEASGSQLRIWSRAAASVVTNIGWYANLPDDCVFKIRHTHETHDLKQLLQQLVDQPETAISVGARGLQQLTLHAPDNYAQHFTQICQDSLRDWHARWLASELARRAGAKVGDFLQGVTIIPSAVGDVFNHT